MKLLVVSDTHGDVRNLAAVLKRIGPVDLAIHCGDGAGDMERVGHYGAVIPPYVQVSGNVDPHHGLPKTAVARAEGRTILVSHGDRLVSGDSIQAFVYAAREAEADAYFFGHTHVPCYERAGGVFVLNPGSLSRPRGGYNPTFAVVNVPRDRRSSVDVTIYELYWNGPALELVEIP